MGSIFHLWGKYSEESFHPLILHSIDVRSVAESILGTFARDKKEADAFMLFLCAMHDIGKATPGFQAKVQAMARRLKEEGYDFPDFAESDHSKLGQYHLSVLLEK
ncbi:CRISPR-associated endonuclease Cas3'', partial [Hydrogenimonas sp.]